MHTVGFWGYCLAAFAYLVFALLIIAARNKSLIAKLLLVCTLVSSAVAAIAAAQIQISFSLKIVFLFEAIKFGVWSFLLLSFNSKEEAFAGLIKQDAIKKYLLLWGALIGSYLLGEYLGAFSTKYLFLLFIVLSLWSLVLLEQLYRSADSQVRWAIWPLIIALGSVSVFDFVLFAQASMVGSLDFNFWYSRGYIGFVIVPLLLVSTRRVKNGEVRIFVSRNVVFYSSMLMIAGLYLLVMALSGYLINYFGGEWGDIFSIAFLVLGGIVLAMLLITESIRRRIKVFIAKNFFANKFEYRDEWLQLIGKIETSNAENYYQMATQIMMSKLDAQGGALVKQNGPEQFKVQYAENITFRENLDEDLVLICQFCQQQGWIVDLHEYAQDPQSYPSLFIQPIPWQKAGIRFIIPIFIGKAFYGLFMLKCDDVEIRLNWEDRDLFFAVSKQLGNFVSLHEANDKIAESKQFDAFNRMSAFLVHDLKNVLAQLRLITVNAEKHRNNPEFVDDVFETVESASERLDKMLSQLRNKQVAQTQQQSSELNETIRNVVKIANGRLPKVEFNEEANVQLSIDHENLQGVLNHIVQNAQEASNADSMVQVGLKSLGDKVEITVKDSGIGMSSEFIRTRLFKPFDTTKGNAGMGIGVYEARQFIEGVAGEIKVDSIEGQGTKFTILLPQN